MEDRTKQFRVGVVVFVTILVTGLLIVMTSDMSWMPFKKQYQLHVLVSEAPGVAPETPVRRHGILIGRVAAVEDTDDGALLTLNINEGKHIKSNEIARVQTSLIGDAVVNFTATGSSKGAQIVPPGATVDGMYNPSPLDLIANLQGDLKQTIAALGRAGDEVATLAERVNNVLGEQDVERLNSMFTKMEVAMEQFGSVMGNVDDVLGDEQFKTKLKEGLAQIPSVMSDARAILGALERAVVSADENLKNLQGLTGPLGERGPEIVAAMEGSVENLSTLLNEVASFAKGINSSEGTIGLLLHDRQLYDQVNNAILEVRQLVAGVDKMRRTKIQAILDDVRILTSKLSRDPSRMVRGVIKPETRLGNEPYGRQR